MIALLASCGALAVPLPVMAAVVQVESGGNRYAIGVVGGELERQPAQLREAVATVAMLEKQGYNYSLGAAQINKKNFAAYGITSPEQAFDYCTSVTTGARILAECQQRAQGDWGKAFSCYYSGNFVTGFKDGYVQKVSSALQAITAANKGGMETQAGDVRRFEASAAQASALLGATGTSISTSTRRAPAERMQVAWADNSAAPAGRTTRAKPVPTYQVPSIQANPVQMPASTASGQMPGIPGSAGMPQGAGLPTPWPPAAMPGLGGGWPGAASLPGAVPPGAVTGLPGVSSMPNLPGLPSASMLPQAMQTPVPNQVPGAANGQPNAIPRRGPAAATDNAFVF